MMWFCPCGCFLLRGLFGGRVASRRRLLMKRGVRPGFRWQWRCLRPQLATVTIDINGAACVFLDVSPADAAFIELLLTRETTAFAGAIPRLSKVDP